MVRFRLACLAASFASLLTAHNLARRIRLSALNFLQAAISLVDIRPSASVQPGSISIVQSVAELQATLLQLLATIPPGTKPYLAIASFLRNQLHPDVPQAAIYQLYFLPRFLGLCVPVNGGVCLSLSSFLRTQNRHLSRNSLYARWRKGIFWVFRMQASPRMKRPNATVSGLPWLGGHTAAWSLSTSFIPHLATTSNADLTTHCLACLASIYGLGLPIAYFSALLPLGILSGLHYRQALQQYRGIDKLLVTASQGRRERDKFSVPSLRVGLSLRREALRRDGQVLVTVAFLHLSSLRRMLEQTERGVSASRISPQGRNFQQRRVHRTLQSLILTVLIFTLLGPWFTGISI
ncbi:hypothetical protein JCM11641_000735 [Rhodosporidiobolus odoratus]